MIIKKKKIATAKKDPKKERIFRLLAEQANLIGIQVRREALRRGHGWKATSGGCLLRNSNLILIDQALGQDEQIEVLISYLRALEIKLSKEFLELLPNSTRALLSGEVQQAA